MRLREETQHWISPTPAAVWEPCSLLVGGPLGARGSRHPSLPLVSDKPPFKLFSSLLLISMSGERTRPPSLVTTFPQIDSIKSLSKLELLRNWISLF